MVMTIAGVGVSCSNNPEIPYSMLENVETKINLAEELGAKTHAPLAFKSGQDNLSEANRHIKTKNMIKPGN